MPIGKGYGQNYYADLYGGGGALHVVGARAVGSHVVRVAFDRLPLVASASGRRDGANPANYVFEALVGTVVDPGTGLPATVVTTGVSSAVVTGPAVGVSPGCFGVDVHVDRALVVALTYQVTVLRVTAADGSTLGTPYKASFAGIVGLPSTRPQPSPAQNIDLANPPATGIWDLDTSGDLGLDDSGLASVKKRVFRRLSTTLAGFRWLPTYGCLPGLKGPVRATDLPNLRAGITTQLQQEPEVQSATVTVSLDPLGVLYLTPSLTLLNGAVLGFSAALTDAGLVEVGG